MRAYHFCGHTLRNGQPIPEDGVTLRYDGPLPPILCEQGLHASAHPFDALQYAPGHTLCLVELGGTIVSDTDKHVATERTILCRINAEPLLLAFARRCALDVIHLWDAPAVVREYLETGDETKRAAARDAAMDAARAAAWAAARAAAWAAARAAAWAAAMDAAWDAAWAAVRAAAWAAVRAAARDAAWDAAWAAAWVKYRGWFTEMVNAEFSEVVR